MFIYIQFCNIKKDDRQPGLVAATTSKRAFCGAVTERVTVPSLSVTLNVWRVAAAVCTRSLIAVPLAASADITGG
ncbi:hypothetical protein DPMN_102413 [Dreissena polymorpha]|uniref:Uncharacterized protein n=1 Tax=Dreissena polymorpha TaxID=45954 RepID=A0A9D4LKG1_DREPO|nr:hypothetical protein DPMN_102413 [Dreissena polymorpha]